MKGIVYETNRVRLQKIHYVSMEHFLGRMGKSSDRIDSAMTRADGIRR